MAITETDEIQAANTRFIRRSMSEPLLSREREAALAIAWRSHDDEDALHELINSYTRLVIAIAAKFRHYGLPMGDLIQEGAVGLMQAAARFEPEREVRFSTYASWWIRSSVQDYILRNWSIVRTGTTAAQKSLFFNLRRLRARIEDNGTEFLSESGRDEIATTLGVSLRDVERMEQRLTGSDQSLNTTLGEGGEDEWMDFLADTRPGPEDSVMVLHDSNTRARWLREAMERLDQRERHIIQSRRLTDEGMTLEELGEELGVSKERVRQLEHRALKKLREAILEKQGKPTDLILEG